MSWRNLHKEIQADIYKDTHIPVKSENLSNISEQFLLQNTKLFINDEKVKLTYITGSIISYSGTSTDASYNPEPFIEMEFDSDTPLTFLSSTDIRLEFDKRYFQDITPLIHAYIFSDIQRDGKEWSFIIGKDDKQYFQYNLHGHKYAVRNDLKETNTVNTFHLFIQLVVENSMPLMSSPSAYQNIQKTTSKWTSVWEYLQGFFDTQASTGFKIFWLLVALFAGMMHGLLPWHSKSLIGTYMISNAYVRYKEIALLIGTVTFSHTIFIFILATIILALQKWLSAVTSYVVILSSVWYICFWLYFFFRWKKALQEIHSRSDHSLFHKHSIHNETCWCDEHGGMKDKTLKGTVLSGFLAGANPCIDALALFIFAITIGNGFYAFGMIICFSLGLWLMLGILSILVKQSQRFLSKKSQSFSEKVSARITLWAGVLIIIMGTLWLIWK
jgi:ABC-type nickel/cobalt efflux system permease component RcnA